MKKAVVVSSLLALLLPAGLAAESLRLEEIVIKGEKESPREESLSIREVRESPARDIGEALCQVEGITAVRKGAIANDVVLRGFQKDNINVLIDGLRVHGACPARMDPPAFHYDFAEIEQIRVIKGPYDLENPGSLGGTIEAKTKQPGPGFGGDLSLTYGSWESINAAADVSYGLERLDGLLGYAYKSSDVPESGDGKLITDIYPATSPNRYRPGHLDSKAYEINTGWVKLGLDTGADGRTELGYSYQDADHVLYPYLKMDADFDRTQRLNWTWQSGKLSPRVEEVKLQAYWDEVEHLMDDRLRQSSVGKPRPWSMQTDASTRMTGAKAGGALAVGPGTMKAGVDYYRRNWDAVNRRAMFTMAAPYTPVNMIPDVDVDNVGLYLGYEFPLTEQLSFTGGLRGDLTRVEAGADNNLTSAEGRDRDFSEVGGNLQLTWRPTAEVEIFAGAGRGTRPPDPEELFINLPGSPTWSGDPDLEPTINHQLDLGAKYATGRFFVNAALFYSDLTDYVNFEQITPTLKQYTNIDATMWGGELGSQVSLPCDLFLKGALSYVEGENTDGDRPLSEIPPLKGLAGLRYDNGAWFLEATENFSDRQDRVDENLNEDETAGWMTTDLKAGMHYRAWSVYAGVNNLLDKHYYSHLSYQRDPFASGVKVPENGRYLYLTVAGRF